jgi:guanylate kinase
MIEEDAFLEYATVHGHFYGTSRAAVFADLEAGLDVLLDIDVQGARQVRSRMPETVSVFVLAPSLEELRRRLVGRGLDDEAVIEARLKVAREEIAAAGEYDFVIVNHDVEKASLELKSIFLAERCRTARRAGCVEVVLRTFE